MAKKGSASTKQPKQQTGGAKEKDVDYTIAGLLTICAVVLFTAIFFAQPNVAERANFGNSESGNIAGGAISTGGTNQGIAAQNCEVTSLCDGSRLIRQQRDCSQFVAFCQNGCEFRNTAATCI